MSAHWKYQAHGEKQVVNANNETHTYMYMEQLMSFPADVQDRIIEEISHLPQCNSDAIAKVIANHSIKSSKP